MVKERGIREWGGESRAKGDEEGKEKKWSLIMHLPGLVL